MGTGPDPDGPPIFTGHVSGTESLPPPSPASTTPHEPRVTTTGTSTTANAASGHTTSCPTPSPSGPPNVLQVVIHTTVTIRDFDHYYTVPISNFTPSYVALSDGSLVSPVFMPNLIISEFWLVMGGALAMFFFINTYKSFTYCRVVKVKNKSLFYMLLASQAIGLFASLFFIVADFDSDLDCTLTGIVKKSGVLVSTTLLIPGILGTKAYKCLSNAGFVIVFLGLIRAAIVAVTGIVLAEYKGGRRFTGTCETVYESALLPVSVALQFVESAFICVCFLYAVYRSYRSPADHARLSLSVQDDESSTLDLEDKDEHSPTGEARRGWWDYVPGSEGNKSRELGPPSPALPSPKDLANRFRQWWTGEPVLPSTVFQRKPSIPGELPIPQPRIPQPRISSASGANALSLRLATTRDTDRPSSPPPPSVMDRIIRYVPRAELFRAMLRNELLYTTFLTAVLLVITIVMWFGITQHFLLGANSWLMVDWAIISICTMHSFSRVARRHERDAWLQNPENWRSIHRAEVEDRTTLRPKNSRRAWSPVSVSSHWRHRHRAHGDSDGPYSNSISRYPSSRASEPPDPRMLAGPSRVRTASSARSRDVSRSTSVVSSPVQSMDSVYRPAQHVQYGSPRILPSPEYPSSNASTPHSSDRHAMLSRASSAVAVAGGPSPTSPQRRSCSAPRMRTCEGAAPITWDPENPEPPDPGPGET
ncbi:hypothetical protein TRAPUB_12423 [Trametes pubescens]|uniref:Uncharacterized protein n=1 Tax=Trametes pubescens TaxID=154538 RepID=A0A1M2VU49_TRAPU|nr:hypothetical protein TRAPUB_12423 [Trametes pubescens]